MSSGWDGDLAHRLVGESNVCTWPVGESGRLNRAFQIEFRLEFCRDQIITGLPCQAQMFELCPFVNGDL